MSHEGIHGTDGGAGGCGAPAGTHGVDAHTASLPPGIMANPPAGPVTRAVPPAAEQDPRPEEHAEPSADAAGEPAGEVLRGVPEHTGKRPPTYPPHPLRPPSIRGGDDFAAFSPSVLLDGATVERLTVRAASVRGDSHNWEGTCRQDAMTVTRIGPPEAEMLLLAVADGVGSAKYSHIGSYRATRQAAVHLDREAEGIHAALCARDAVKLSALANKAIAGAVAELRDGWERTARYENRPYADGDYATTLHVLLVPTDPRVRDRVVFGVGDGGLFVLRDTYWHHGTPAGEGVIDTRTEALPHAYSTVESTLLRTVPGEVLLLGTDGITNPLTQKDPEFAQRLAHAWGGAAPSLSDFLWQAQTRAKSYDDDRTVVCVWEEA
ncbi:protein phosphatase 2C domain-containing protein [Streptomyces chitinivorans]|uniref:Protein phosphatase 2C domain-containing protein n=1 Tax=Streptomyces chitinivorans TaxID=1257027 RepID=A0ABW7HMC3_9ACTN|nr:protein phosphatase 2C domain-containing protein [Streptomyces chitinivorans]MDH2409005.1 protein phosphatase 2C domain-containing protein [Streptomyces chitinivorans]